MPKFKPYRRISEETELYEINLLNADNSQLKRISADRSLGLNLGEMRKIQTYFKKEKRNPADVELEALAQSWSEHCCYKSSKPVLRETVFRIKAPQSILTGEDAGVVEFNEEYAYVIGLESHNHPSAIEPYGGASTGVGGIVRDVLCMGAQPIALIDPLFFGPLNISESELPTGMKHPKFLLNGVVSGISAYGNRIGIPTLAGMVEFHESYTGNCLVNVACIGIAKKKNIVRSIAGNAGDYYIMAGGKTGRDGIHGVTFASAELEKESEEKSIPAVQLGYAIMKEPLIHACLEAVEKGLLTGMKDFGGGGLSCVSSEMAYAGGKGAIVELDRILLKEKGIAPWEIWVSESQERMMMSVKPENVDNVLEIFEFWDVPATIIGRIDNSKRIRVRYNGRIVLDLDLEFLIKGVRYERPYRIVKRSEKEINFRIPCIEEIAKKILNSPRVGSKESIVRRYDFDVHGNTILKPMQGIVNKQGHGDAAVIKPLEDTYQGLAITSDVNPPFCKLNPYWGAASAVEETIRNLVAVNSVPHSMADCLNFGNPEKKDRMGDFVSCCKGLYFAANSFGIPFVSGNVSLYNESEKGPIVPTPTIVGVGIVKDVRNVVSSDLKDDGNFIYLVGSTRREMGGSEYYRILKLNSGRVPRVYPDETKKNMNSLLRAMDLGIVRSCHDLSEGGLFVSISEMAFGGDLGVDVDLCRMEKLRADFKLFSESNGRWLVEVKPGNSKKFEKIVPDAKRIGRVTKEKEIRISDKKFNLNLSLDELRDKWNSAIEREV